VSSLQVLPSVCPHDCPSVCALEVERDGDGRIGRLRGAAQPYTDGVICAKVARYAERVHHPERLRQPLRRVGPKGSGRFEPIPWDAALDLVAQAFRDAAAGFGAESVWPYHYAGTMGHVQRDGIKRLRHVMRYSGMGETICTALPDAGWRAGVGAKIGVDSREMAQSDLIVVWGGNPVATQVNVMNWVAKAKKARGAKLVVVDVYRTPTAEKADMALILRPGTDAALACAVMHVLFAEGWADRDYIRRHTRDADALERHLEQRTPEWAAGITGLSAEQIVAFARLYGSTRRSFLRVGYGFARGRNGAVALHAVTCLPAITGAWRHEGGGALYSGSGLHDLDKTLIEGLDARDAQVRVLDMSRIGPVLTGDAEALKGGPPVKAMLIQNQNPAAVAPDSAKVRAGLMRDDLFVCVHEQFMTETAQLADVVLPATTFLEHDDFYTAGGHVFLQVARAVIPPFAEARSNHRVLQGLAARLGAEHPGFAMSEWELIDATLRASNLPGADEAHAMRWVDCGRSFEDQHHLIDFPNPTGRFRFAPDWPAVGPDHHGMPTLPDQWDAVDAATPERPFRLVTAPSRHFLNTTFTETPGSRRGAERPTALVHPADCATLGLVEGGRARLGNERGAVVVHVRPFDGLVQGTVVVEGIWPNAAFAEGRGINTLTSAEPAKPNGGAVFHDTAVWMRRDESSATEAE